jgi:23S rRNA pseudouridine1911/1915/1917 synthase
MATVSWRNILETDHADQSGRILYMDDCLAVVNKKIGEVCENDAADKSLSLVENLRAELEARAGKKLPELEAVHRIDQPVSGAVLLAFDKQTLAHLSAQFAAGQIRKKYHAIVERRQGVELASSGRLDHMLRFDHKHHKATVCLKEDIRKGGSDWKRAALSWTLAGNGDRYAFLEVIPETGRTHQIRAQLAFAGMVIKGDLKYGAKRSDPLGGIRLHAYAIQFKHPVTGDSITVTAPILQPDALWQAFAKVVG